MSEGDFHFETSATFQANVDSKSTIEKGEIAANQKLEGYWPISVVNFKNGRKALFRITDDRFEVLVFKINEAGRFELVPPAAQRTIDGSSGVIQHLPENSNLAVYHGDWKSMVSADEIIKAAAFDFALGSRARTAIDILLDADKKRLYLINNDSTMLQDYQHEEKSPLLVALGQGKTVPLSQEVIDAFQRVIGAEASLREGLNEKEKAFLDGFLARAKKLIQDKQLIL